MTQDEVDQNCDALIAIKGLGPGEIAGALKRVQDTLLQFKSEAWRETVQAPLLDVDTAFKTWFSPSRWKEKDDGKLFSARLDGDIERLRFAMTALLS